ncbi:Rieske (2Fe-2S) protein [Streptomyces sp. HSG2]|uniref:Rieske (2Fe-2S) protein n=1 Tax=Streptomyces sp. HSG2 TaxID=2797167 RepID=UPI001906CA40|nr:Rieske (2Fe-2S) protein [Streptomyces sp. HSG2]
MPHHATRRTILLATGAAAVTAGCGAAETETSASAPDLSRPLARTEDIPVGGGVVFPDDRVVVTQPEEGDFRAFSALCTHQNCLVTDVSGGTINCACHDSRFRVDDGSVERGPATRPLPSAPVTVEGDSVHLA